jgi:3',5'-cyclic AMP phosphodiesterase CpdA
MSIASAATARVTRIAHLSDAHILEHRPASRRTGYDLGLRFVSLGRPLDAWERRKKLACAFAAARRAGADHFVVSGDLTETGTEEQFEAFAEVLDATQIDPGRVTLVPGNHDAYSRPDAWARALEGPLAPYARTSARAPGHVVALGDVTLLPVDVACHQPVTRSSGELTRLAAESLECRFRDPLLARDAVVLVQHHPPYRRFGAWQWIDGLRGWAPLMNLLERFAHVQLLHGHLHRAVSTGVTVGRDRVFGAPAVVDDAHAPRVRMYEVRGGALASVGLVGV